MAQDLIVELETPLEEVETTVTLSPDIYPAEFIDAEKKLGPSRADYIAFTPKIYDKDGKGHQLLPENVSLAPQAEWKLKTILIALGVKEPKGKKLNITKMLFRKFNAEVGIATFEDKDGKKRKKNEIIDYFPISKEEDVAPLPSSKGTKPPEAKGKVKEPEPEEDEVDFDS